MKISTSYLAAEEIGVFYLLISILSYFSLTLISPIGNFINRNVHKWISEGSILTNLGVYNKYLLLISIASIPIVYIAQNFLGILTQIDTIYLLGSISVGIYFTTLNTLFSPTLNLLNHRVAFVVFGNLTILFNILFSFILITIFESTGFWWFLGQIASHILFTIVSGIYFIKVVKSKIINLPKMETKSVDFKSVISFALPLSLATLFLWVTNESYRFFIEKYLTLNYLGLLAVGIAVSTKISTAVETLLHQLLHPKFYNDINTIDKSTRGEAWNSFFNLSLPSYISVTFFISFLSPFLLRLLAGESFYSAWDFLIFGAILNLIRMITNHVALIAHTELETKSLILPGFISAITSITFIQLSVLHSNYYYLVPISLLIGAAAGMLAMIFQMNKRINIKVKVSNILLPCMLSLVYFASIPFYKEELTLLYSISVIGGFGVIFILTQLFIFKRNKII
ncbi:lipopolysaccharide biosynthesis protein [Halobacteriovorax marinus]|uniref:lipopolysaccharide biosynthesis protein n=1 Tax=Halobacteriovorax marinus TaxID=97084 RepID=UPI003A8DB0E7